MGKTVSLICDECGASFQKLKGEYNRRIKRGMTRFFCSLSCGASKNGRENPSKGNPQSLIGFENNRRDDFTQFRWFIRRIACRASKKGYQSDIDLSFLRDLWHFQNGICPFTGWKLILPYDAEKWSADTPFGTHSASLDRIDNSKGYLKGNVRFVSVIFNFARNKFTDEDVIEFSKSIVSYQTKLGDE